MKKKFLLFLVLFCFFSLFLFATDWSGTYKWTNPTNKNNGGKVKEIVFEIKKGTSFPYEVYSVDKNTKAKICPMFPPNSPESKEWHQYNEKSEQGEAFRANNKRINTSIFNPSKWMQGELSYKNNTIKCGITASAMGMSFNMDAVYEFFINDKGKKCIKFSTLTDSSVAKGMIFTNPEKGSDGSFILEEVE